MNLPTGTLVLSRVVGDPATALSAALDRELTGYAVFEPQDALLLDADGEGVVTFSEGVPVCAYHTGTGRGGANALADLAVPGPYSVELRELPADDHEEVRGGVVRGEVIRGEVVRGKAVHSDSDLRVAPGTVADRLAGDPDLAERVRVAAPSDRRSGDEGGDETMGAVEAFLDDGEKIDAIRERAREEAKERAEEWGLNSELEG